MLILLWGVILKQNVLVFVYIRINILKILLRFGLVFNDRYIYTHNIHIYFNININNYYIYGIDYLYGNMI